MPLLEDEEELLESLLLLERSEEELELDVDLFLGFFLMGGSSCFSARSAGLLKFLLRIFVRESLIIIFRLFLHS